MIQLSIMMIQSEADEGRWRIGAPMMIVMTNCQWRWWWWLMMMTNRRWWWWWWWWWWWRRIADDDDDDDDDDDGDDESPMMTMMMMMMTTNRRWWWWWWWWRIGAPAAQAVDGANVGPLSPYLHTQQYLHTHNDNVTTCSLWQLVNMPPRWCSPTTTQEHIHDYTTCITELRPYTTTPHVILSADHTRPHRT